jgi:hypothetical protein
MWLGYPSPMEDTTYQLDQLPQEDEKKFVSFDDCLFPVVVALLQSLKEL